MLPKIVAFAKAFTDNTPARWGSMNILLPVGISFVLAGVAMWGQNILVAIIFLAFGGILTIFGLIVGIYWIINYNPPDETLNETLNEIKKGIEILLERTEPPKHIDVGAINRDIKRHLDEIHERTMR